MAEIGNTAGRPLRVLQITDFHLFGKPESKLLGVSTQDSFEAVIDLVRANDWPPDIVLATGDLVQDQAPAAYRRLHGQLASLGVPVHCLPGNHDDPSLMTQWLAGEGVYSLDDVRRNGWQIILLDSTVRAEVGGHMGPAELERLDKTLADHPDHHSLVCLHHHPVPMGADWMSELGLANADEFFAVIDRYPQVRGVIWGHVHQDFMSNRNGAMLLGTPSTCFQFKPDSRQFRVDSAQPGYRWLELYADGRIETRVRRLTDYALELDAASEGY